MATDMFTTILIAVFILIIIVVVARLLMVCNVKVDGFTTVDSDTKTFMIRDVKTNLWLNIDSTGMVRFVPSGFGLTFRMSVKPEDFLPLRSANNPNDYIISSYNGNTDFRIVPNPGSDLLKIQVLNLEGKNILGYLNNNNGYTFVSVDQAGFVSNVDNPSMASVVNMIFV